MYTDCFCLQQLPEPLTPGINAEKVLGNHKSAFNMLYKTSCVGVDYQPATPAPAQPQGISRESNFSSNFFCKTVEYRIKVVVSLNFDLKIYQNKNPDYQTYRNFVLFGLNFAKSI